MLWPNFRAKMVQVSCLFHAWNGNGATGTLVLEWGGAQLTASWAGEKPGFHLSDFTE